MNELHERKGASERRSVHTYTPPIGPGEKDLVRFAELVEVFANGGHGRAALVSATGEREETPDQLFDVLRRAARALSGGRGFTVMPTNTELTTQEAADFLGMSRPTLIKLLNRGEIAFDTVGRHRRVRLDSLLHYQDEAESRRRDRLDAIARSTQEMGPETAVGVPLRRLPESSAARREQ